ncbi:MAG: long-chain-acyl-CoA synthetase [Spirochaetota bacterium]
MSRKETLNINHIVSRLALWAKKLPFLPAGALYLLTTHKESTVSIGSRLERHARVFPEKTAILYKDKKYTHKRFNEISNQIAHCLLAKGVKKGDTVALFLENRPELMFCIAALAKIGAVAGLLNTSQKGDVLAHSIGLIQPKYLLFGGELLQPLQTTLPLIALNREQIYYIPDDEKPQSVVEYTNIAIDSSKYPSSNPATTRHVKAGDACYYIFTSGTTGLPKASIMTHLRWMRASASFGSLALNMTPDDVIYISLPLYHNNALTVAWSAAVSGGSAIAISRKFSASKFWEETRKFKATAFCYIGELCRYLINQPQKENDKDNPVVKIVGNGLRPDIWQEFKQRFGIEQVYEFYAASESNLSFTNYFNFDYTVGFSLPGRFCLVEYDIDVEEVKKDSRGYLIPVKRGGTGLLLIQISELFPFDGYTDEKANEKKLIRNAFSQGDLWFNSGDLMKDVGFWHSQFVDRLGDTFRWKGENISTYEVELTINRSPQVRESIVYGVTVPGAEGRAGMAALIVEEESATAGFDFSTFSKMLKSSLPAYAIPLFIRILKNIETTGTFKYKKGNLKKQAYDIHTVEDEIYFLHPKEKDYRRLDQQLFEQIPKLVTGGTSFLTTSGDKQRISSQRPDSSSFLFRLLEKNFSLTDFIQLAKQVVVPEELNQVIDRNPKQVNAFGYDPWGFNPDIFKIITTFYKIFYDHYFRVEVSGYENIPPDGRVFIIANHAGQLPIDGGLLGVALSTNPSNPRVPRIMVERFLSAVPFVGNILNRYGAIIGDPENCIKILQKEEAVIVFPEGVRGSGKLFHKRYKLQRFGTGFMHIAMNHKTPIIPVGITGSEETMPSIADIKPLARLLGIPYAPLTVPVPLPSKIFIKFGKRLDFTGPVESEVRVQENVDMVKAEIASLIQLGLKERKAYYGKKYFPS